MATKYFDDEATQTSNVCDHSISLLYALIILHKSVACKKLEAMSVSSLHLMISFEDAPDK
jgi:hypothetical protein